MIAAVLHLAHQLKPELGAIAVTVLLAGIAVEMRAIRRKQ